MSEFDEKPPIEEMFNKLRDDLKEAMQNIQQAVIDEAAAYATAIARALAEDNEKVKNDDS